MHTRINSAIDASERNGSLGGLRGGGNQTDGEVYPIDCEYILVIVSFRVSLSISDVQLAAPLWSQQSNMQSITICVMHHCIFLHLHILFAILQPIVSTDIWLVCHSLSRSRFVAKQKIQFKYHAVRLFVYRRRQIRSIFGNWIEAHLNIFNKVKELTKQIAFLSIPNFFLLELARN